MEDSEYIFNVDYARERGVSEEELQTMQKIYELLYEILARPFGKNRTHKQAVQLVEALEFTLQLFWKFDICRGYHSYWYRLDGCECPKRDNSDIAFAGRRVINQNCPFHGEVL